MPKGPSRLRAGLHHKKEARPHGPAKAEKATQSAQLGARMKLIAIAENLAKVKL
jgi:hypothetical protein